MEQAITTATERAEPTIHYLDMGDFVLTLLSELEPERESEPELAHAGWPAGIHFEDAPEALEEPRGQNGWNGAANAIDLTGKRFGKLLVIARTAGNTRQGAFWRCLCDCGGETIVKSSHLRRGHTTSCGCMQRAKQFQPGSNEPPQLEQQPTFMEEQQIRDALLVDLCKRMTRARAVDARAFGPANGSRAWERRLRNRVAWRCRHLPDGARRLRVERIFKSIVAGLPTTGSAGA
jgi:hypothetical protein